MKQLTQNEIDLAFLHPDCVMFSDVIGKLEAATDLPEVRIRDMISGLRRVANTLNRPPEDVPCDARWLQPRLSKIEPAALGLKEKTWQNVVSNTRAALDYAGVIKRRNRKLDDFTPEWRALWNLVMQSGDPTLVPSLNGLLYFFSRIGVAPGDVSDAHALAYKAGIELNEISRSPDRAYRAAINGWNLAATRLPGWPKNRLSLPSRQKIIQLPDGVLPLSFSKALDTYLAGLGNVDPFGDRGRRRALRPASVLHYKRLILRFVAGLVKGGMDPSELTGLEAILRPDVFKAGLQHLLGNSADTVTPSVSQTAMVLNGLAKTLPLAEADLREIARLTKKVSLPRQTGMTTKNRARLRPLQNDAVTMRLLNLPEVIFKRNMVNARGHAFHLAREDAIAIGLLTYCPIRVQNLAQIHLVRNIQRPGDGRVFLVFDPSEVKNGISLEFDLPKDLVTLIDRHLAGRVPTMCPPGTPWLFPRRKGGDPIGASELSGRIKKRLRKELGLEVNAHLFRHFAAMNLLDDSPGSYEAARQLLGHSTGSHTLSVYSGMETRTATKQFADLVTRKKGRL